MHNPGRCPDHAASADPGQFREYVRLIREAETLLGDGRKRLQESEADVRRVSRQSLVARRFLPVGTIIARADLACQRPGTGIPARELDAVVGQAAACDLPAGTVLRRGHLRTALAA